MVSWFTKTVLDYRFDDLNTTSRLARAVLQQREQIAHDISSVMNKLQITGLNLIWDGKKKNYVLPYQHPWFFFIRGQCLSLHHWPMALGTKSSNSAQVNSVDLDWIYTFVLFHIFLSVGTPSQFWNLATVLKNLVTTRIFFTFHTQLQSVFSNGIS